MEQFRAIHRVAPEWLQWLMTLTLLLALRRVDLVNLRFEDVVEDRIVSAIRKTDTQARDVEATSVDFPIHPDVRRVIAESRRSSVNTPPAKAGGFGLRLKADRSAIRPTTPHETHRPAPAAADS
jgi:integrase